MRPLINGIVWILSLCLFVSGLNAQQSPTQIRNDNNKAWRLGNYADTSFFQLQIYTVATSPTNGRRNIEGQLRFRRGSIDLRNPAIQVSGKIKEDYATDNAIMADNGSGTHVASHIREFYVTGNTSLGNVIIEGHFLDTIDRSLDRIMVVVLINSQRYLYLVPHQDLHTPP